MKLRVYESQNGVINVLGPGKRTVVWTQGCKRRCPGCVSPKSRPLDGGKEHDAAVLGMMIGANSDEGLTVSGGEPFLQAAAVREMIVNARKLKPDMGVIVYTGYTYEQLQELNSEDVNALLGEIDLLIDGEYIHELNDDKALRGSSNQRAIMLTDRYKDITKVFGVAERETQPFLRVDKVLFAGLIKKSQMTDDECE